MEKYRFKRNDSPGEFVIFESREVEYENPLKHFSDFIIEYRVSLEMDRHAFRFIKLGFPKDLIRQIITEKVVQDWNEQYRDIIDTEIPENLLKILKSNSKKEQECLLKGMNLTSYSLLAFIFKAWLNFGFTFSQYQSEKYSRDVDRESLPNLIYVDNGEVEKVGESEYTNGKLKQIMEQRKVIVAKILDKGEDWHCLIITYDSLLGKETWRNGQIHYHYISNYWGISRKNLVERIKSGKYPSTSVHIEYFNHRNRK